ncbi:MAG: hypothetical protein ACR2QG_06995 [Gammaproteobacteria bacterium]
MRFLSTFILAVVLSAVSHFALALESEEQVIRRAEWPTYVNGSNVSALPQLRRILSRFSENDRMSITIYYPGGVQGTEWAQQLYNWFVAYGVPMRYLKMELGSGAVDQLRLVLVDKG